MINPCANAKRGKRINAQRQGNFISSLKAHAAYVFDNAIRILADDLNGGVLVSFINFQAQGSADAVFLQKHHHFAAFFLFRIGGLNVFGRFGADFRHRCQALRVEFDYLQHVGTEMLNQGICKGRTYALKKTGR